RPPPRRPRGPRRRRHDRGPGGRGSLRADRRARARRPPLRAGRSEGRGDRPSGRIPPCPPVPTRPGRGSRGDGRAPVPGVRLRRRRLPRAHPDGVRPWPRCETEVPVVGERPERDFCDRRAEEERMGDPPRDAMSGDGARLETAAIHAGQDPEPLYGSVNVPIYQTSTYAQERVGEAKAWDYARGGNPTRAAFETALAALEGGERCLAFASGMAAE